MSPAQKHIQKEYQLSLLNLNSFCPIDFWPKGRGSLRRWTEFPSQLRKKK